MFDGKVSKQPGVLVVKLPNTKCAHYTTAHDDVEKATIYPETNSRTIVTSREIYEDQYPYAPARLLTT